MAPARQTQSSFLRNVAGASTAYLLSPVVGVATAPVLAHALGVVGRGHFAATTAPTMLLAVAATLGLPEAATYFIASGKRHAMPTLWRAAIQTLAFSLVLVVGLYFAAPVIAPHEASVQHIMRLGALTLPFALLVGVIRGAAAGAQEWTRVNLERGGGNLLRLIFVVLVAVAWHLTLATATFIYLLSPVLSAVVYIPMLMRMARDREYVASRVTLRSDPVLSYGLQVWAGGMAGIVLDRLDQVLMSSLSNSFQLGLYAAAVAIAEIPYVVGGATRDVILAADSQNANDALVARASRLTLLVALMIAAVLAAASPLLVDLAYGSAFSRAVPILLILSLAAVLYSPGMTSGGVLLSRGSATQRVIPILAAVVVNVALLFLLVPAEGGIGAAVASAAAYALYSAMNLMLINRVCAVRVRDLILPTREDFRDLRAAIGTLRASRRDSRETPVERAPRSRVAAGTKAVSPGGQRRPPWRRRPGRGPTLSWNILAALLCLAVIVADGLKCPIPIRATVVLLFAIWVPGATMLGLLRQARTGMRPDVPALAISLSLLIVFSGLPIEFGLFPSRFGFGVFAAVCFGFITILTLRRSTRERPGR